MSQLQAGVIGVGYLGRFHAEKYQLVEHAKLAAICDNDANRIRELSAKWNCCCYVDYRDLLGKVDLVSIVTPTSSHFEIARFFLENGVHVLLEKPMTSTIEEAEELIDLAHRHSVVLQIGYLEQFNPILALAKKYIERPLFIELLRISPFSQRSQDISVVLDLMIHDIDIVQSIVASDIVDIRACSAPVVTRSMDIASVRLEFSSGCTANLTASRVSFKRERRMRVFENKRYLSVDLDNKYCSVVSLGGVKPDADMPSVDHQEFHCESGDPLYSEIEAFVNSVCCGSTVMVTGDEGLKALKTACRIKTVIQEYNARYQLDALFDCV